ncbi:MAG: hypothetical protein ACI4KR_02825 [Ruminiclostridium sp.]
MKKKSFLQIAALLLSVSLAAGCSVPDIQISTVTKETDAAVTSETTEPPTDDTANEEKTPEETSASSEDGEQKPVEITDITKPYADTELRIYELPDEKEYYVFDLQGSLALLDVLDGNVMAVDLTTGKTGEKESREISDDEWGRYGTSIVNGFPFETDSYLGKITIFDRSFQVISEKTLSEQEGFYCAVAGNFLTWCKEGNIFCYAEIGDDGSIETGEVAVKLPEEKTLSYCVNMINENEFIISYYDFSDYGSTYGILYRDTGEVVPIRVSSTANIACSGGNIIISEYGNSDVEIFNPENPDVIKTVVVPAGANFIMSDRNVESFYFYADNVSEKEGHRSLSIYRYDISSGRLTGTVTTDVEGDYAYISKVSEYGDYAVFNASMGNSTGLLFWQPEEISEPHGYTAISGDGLSKKNSDLAENIREMYSINVYYGQDAVRFFDGYAVVAEYDEKLINNALVMLDGFFGKFPEGFFAELMGNTADYNEICIYLTGKIVPDLNESQSISDAAAFVTTEDNRQLMVMDISQSYLLERNTAHEFMHIIENAICAKCYDELGNWIELERFSRWGMLNPEDFDYYYSYTDENGFTINYSGSEYGGDMYYDGYGMDVNSIYFVDGYSMTYPHEDRARIFENIATTAPDSLPSYFKGTAMQLKTAYLCACIRESFDCITDDTVLFWESGINPEYNLEYFQSNYDLEAYMNEHAAG